MRTNGQLCYFWQRKEDDEEIGQVQTQTLGGGPPPPPGGIREIMLNSDVALISDFSRHYVNPATGSVDCVIQSGSDDVREECPMASTLGYAWVYSDDMDQWLADFRETFLKMTNTGIDTSRCIDQEPLCFVGIERI